MKKLLAALVVGAMTLSSAPAFARDHVVSGRLVSIDARIAHLETRLADGLASGRIDRSEARALRQQIGKLAAMDSTYKADGLTKQEQLYLRHAINLTRDQLQRADGRSGYAVWNDSGRFG